MNWKPNSFKSLFLDFRDFFIFLFQKQTQSFDVSDLKR